MIEGTPNRVLKSIKVTPETHRAIKVKAAAEGVNIEDMVAIAWEIYRNSSKEGGTRRAKSAPQVLVRDDTLTDAEQTAIRLLLVILRSGSPTVQQAITLNLHGFAEPIEMENKRPHGVSSDTIPETIEHLIRATEEVGADENARRRWAEDLRKIQEELASVSSKPGGPAKKSNKGAG